MRSKRDEEVAQVDDHLIQTRRAGGDWVDLCRCSGPEWAEFVATGGRSSTLRFQPDEELRAVDWITREPLGPAITVE